MAKWTIKYHTTSRGDTYFSIATQRKTTVAVLRGLNSYPDKKIPTNVRIKYMSETEYRYYLKDKAADQKKTSTTKTSATTAKTDSNTGKVYMGLEIKAGQDGVLTIKAATSWYSKGSNGKLTKKGTLNKNAKYRVYSYDSKNEAYYIGSSKWVKKSSSVSYSKIPATLPTYDAGTYGTSKDAFKPTTPTIEYNFSMDIYGRPYYRRPLLKSTNSKGTWLTTELRVLGIGMNLSQQITPMRTNGGFFYNIAGANPSTISVSGWVMDSEGIKEFDAFIQRYKQDWEAYASGNQVKLPKTKFYWKNREYTCFIQSLSFNEDSNALLQVRYTMTLMVLSEKRLSKRDDIKNLSKVTNPNMTDATKYYSDLANMFTNTVTGARP